MGRLGLEAGMGGIWGGLGGKTRVGGGGGALPHAFYLALRNSHLMQLEDSLYTLGRTNAIWQRINILSGRDP